MQIVFHECKKAFTSPILITLLLLFSAFNIFLIVSNSYYKEDLKVANKLAETYGVKITDESLNQFEQDLKMDLAELNAITGKEYSSVNDFLEELKHDDYDLYNDDEWAVFTQLQLKEMYFTIAKNIDNDYEKINIKKVAESSIEGFRLTGNAEKTLQKEYEKFGQRFEEMKQNGEHKEWFFVGTQYKMHSFLFRTMFKYLIFEAMILIVLATAFIANFEFENKTHLVSYSTARGRHLMKDKMIASFIIANAITVVLLAITLITYFTVFDYSHLWGSSISSAFNWEYNFPFVAWWELSFIEFLVGVLLIVYVCSLLFSAITFIISVFTKNSYFAFFLYFAFFAIALLVPSFMPKSSNLLFITSFNLSYLVMNPHMLFMGNSGLLMFKNYEIVTVGVWMIIVITLSVTSLKFFKKQEIH